MYVSHLTKNYNSNFNENDDENACSVGESCGFLKKLKITVKNDSQIVWFY